jgi:hypothetical protein
MLKATIDDPSSSIPAEEGMEQLRRRVAKPRPEPAVWSRNPAAGIAIPPTL